MTKIRERLQGKDWKSYKDKLVMICCSKNVNGHVKGIYKDPKTGFNYSHWLSDEEIENLEKSLVYKEGENVFTSKEKI
jgi:hypothetical protein